MKTKYILSALLLGSLSWLSSCTNEIEKLEPKDSVTFYNVYKTEADIEKAMYLVERSFRDNYVSSTSRPALLGELSDKHSGSLIQNEYNWTLSAYNPTNNSDINWGRFYATIGLSNILIENIDRVVMPKERRDYYLGQALFMRAFNYFHLVRCWRDVPIITSSTDVLQHAKSPMKDVLAFAENDAAKAAEMLQPWNQLRDSKGSLVTTKQIVGKGACYALLAHICAWRAEVGNEPAYLDKAVDAANKVINSGEFSLVANPETVITQVRKGNSSEGIFEGDVNLDPGETIYNGLHFTSEMVFQGWPLKTGSSKGQYKNLNVGVLYSTVDAMFQSNDKRINAYFYQYEDLRNDPILQSPGNSSNWAVIQTRREVLNSELFPGFVAFTNFRGNIIIFSLADIILLKAECLAKKGSSAEAILELNKIRTRAGVAGYTPAEGDLFTKVFEEREKEFLFQRVRWFDCIRTGFWKTKLSPVFSDFTPTDIENGSLYFPVSTTAFRNNPLMTQNVYWLTRGIN